MPYQCNESVQEGRTMDVNCRRFPDWESLVSHLRRFRVDWSLIRDLERRQCGIVKLGKREFNIFKVPVTDEGEQCDF